MLPDRVSNPGPLTYESGALPIALRGPAAEVSRGRDGLGPKCPVTLDFKVLKQLHFLKHRS